MTQVKKPSWVGPACPVDYRMMGALIPKGWTDDDVTQLMGKTWVDECAMRAMETLIQFTFYIEKGEVKPTFAFTPGLLVRTAYDYAEAMHQEKKRREAL